MLVLLISFKKKYLKKNSYSTTIMIDAVHILSFMLCSVDDDERRCLVVYSNTDKKISLSLSLSFSLSTSSSRERERMM